jgi:hypothetical protein
MPIDRVTPVFVHHPVFEEPSHDASLCDTWTSCGSWRWLSAELCSFLGSEASRIGLKLP